MLIINKTQKIQAIKCEYKVKCKLLQTEKWTQSMKAWYDTKKRVASCTQNEQQQNAMLQALATGGKWREKIE